MFLFRSFLQSQPQKNEKEQRVFDEANPQAGYTPPASGPSATNAPAISVQEEDDFSHVQVRPLTYAEVATMAGPEGVVPRKVHLPHDLDYYEEEDHADRHDTLHNFDTQYLDSVLEYEKRAEAEISQNQSWGKVRRFSTGKYDRVRKNNKLIVPVQ